MKRVHQKNLHKTNQAQKRNEKRRKMKLYYAKHNKHIEKITTLYNSGSQPEGPNSFDGMILLWGSYIRFSAYQIFILGFITVAKLQL